MCHAAEETASYKLETLAMRYTSAPRYDSALDQWKVDYCKSLVYSLRTLEVTVNAQMMSYCLTVCMTQM